MDFLSKLNCDINNDPNYTVLMSLIVGILFSGISWGLVYVILFLILWEILYFGYLDSNGKVWNLNSRVTIILAALLGFIYGRALLGEDDHYEDYKDFHKNMEYYGKEFEWYD